MDTRKMAAELRLSHWAEVLRERKESGLSVRGWCRENGVLERIYYYWQRKIRESVCENIARKSETAMMSATPEFAQINLMKESCSEGNITIRFGGAVIEITGSASVEVVESVLRMLRQSC